MNKQSWWSSEEGDKVFRQERDSGWQWQQWPALFFSLHGFDVYLDVPPDEVGVAVAHKYEDTIDLWINGYPIEVKAKRDYFTSVNDFPYSTIFSDTVSSYEKRKTLPLAYISISRPTGAMLTFLRDPDKWQVLERFDTTRKIWDKFYACPLKYVRPISRLVEILEEAPKIEIPERFTNLIRFNPQGLLDITRHGD